MSSSQMRLAYLLLVSLFVSGTATPCFAQDPFAEKPQDSAAPSPTDSAGDNGPVVVDLGCSHITSALCNRQNKQLGLLAAGYVLVSVVLVSVWRAWWNRRGTASAGVRLMVPMLVGAAAAGLLVAFDPAQGGDLRCCLAHKVLRAEILLQDSNVARAFLLGAGPAIVLYLVVAMLSGMMREFGGGRA